MVHQDSSDSFIKQVKDYLYFRLLFRPEIMNLKREVQDFLYYRLLFWPFKVMSLKREVSVANIMLLTVASWADVSSHLVYVTLQA